MRSWAPVIVLGWACSTGGDPPPVRGANPEHVPSQPDSKRGAEPNIGSSTTGSTDGTAIESSATAAGGSGGSGGSSGADTPKPTALPAEPEAVELRAADGVVVHGLLHAAAADRSAPIILLFHQAASNAAEYQPIAPRLAALGYHALAIDQRSGGRRFGRDNRTVQAKGKSTAFGPAYRDLTAALAWARERGHERVIVWGSSYSAALVFRLAAEHPDELAAVLAFSPGEYMGGKSTVARWAREVTVPVFVTSAPKEAEAAAAIALAVGEKAQQHVPAKGVHGSSILRPDRNPTGHQAVWTAVEAFLRRVTA